MSIPKSINNVNNWPQIWSIQNYLYSLSLSLSLSHNTLLYLRACSLRDVRVFALGPVLPLRWDGAGLSDALSSCRLSRDRLNLRQETEEADRAYDVSKDIMQNSSSTYLEVLAD